MINLYGYFWPAEERVRFVGVGDITFNEIRLYKYDTKTMKRFMH